MNFTATRSTLMSIGLLGQKIGMTRVYDDKGRLCPSP